MSPRTSVQNEKIRSESIKKILNAAFKLMAKNGFESTSIAQIASEAGVSKGLIYNYFNSKEDLLQSLVNTALSEADKVMADILADDPSVTLENLFRWFFDELRYRTEEWRLITELTLKIDKFEFIQDLTKAKISEYVTSISSLLEQIGVENSKEEARLIASLFDGIGLQYLVIGNDYPIDEIEKYLIEKYCK